MVKTRIIGLTGNVACGKSTVAKFLREKGIPVIDADHVACEVTASSATVLARILTEFGKEVLDAAGGLSRQSLREVIFRDAGKRRKLEAILHPEIRKRSAELIHALVKKQTPTVIYEAPLLIEAGQLKEFEGLLLVTCPRELQKRRLLARDSDTTPALADQMIDAQMPQEEKRKRASWVIENAGTEEQLRSQVLTWVRQHVG